MNSYSMFLKNDLSLRCYFLSQKPIFIWKLKNDGGLVIKCFFLSRPCALQEPGLG